MKIEVYTDGSATVATKPGGYGWVMVVDGAKHSEGNGHMEKASNNDAEMEAAIQGLVAVYKFILEKQCKHPGCEDGVIYEDVDGPKHSASACPGLHGWQVFLVSDSQLILGWADGGYKFKQLDKMDKYHQLKGLVARMKVKTRWVRGHSGDEHNERCDKLANEGRTGVVKPEKPINSENSLIGNKKKGTVCIWYKGGLKVIDLDTNIVEDYKRDIHGSRGSMLEIREDKAR
jgi:ribonuclease HI